jgi:glucose/arabinose dehydrogenase
VARFTRTIPIALALVIGTLVTPVSARVAPAPDATQPAAAALRSGQVEFRLLASGLTLPVGITNAGDGTNRLFVVQQNGIVKVVINGAIQSGAFLDVRSVAGGFSTGGERGLLGLAFHPSFESNRKLYAYYTDGTGDVVISEFTANSARTSASVSTADKLFDIDHSTYPNHNGGQLAFGPDGYLYIFTGDGGGAGDPLHNAQNKNSLLGKVLRVSVSGNGAYGIPGDNPFAGSTPGANEVWDFGLRNPWRASFDRANGNLWIADVGQNSYEEINREPASSSGGVNYGWPCREGKHTFQGGCTGTGPIAEYTHAGGNCSVTGGYVYRGTLEPDLRGHYVLADYCSGRVWTIPAGGTALAFHRDTTLNISSFGESESGELYAVDHGRGRLYAVVAPPFSDIANSQFYYDIKWAFAEGVTTGCTPTTFCPNSIVTREQMASFLVRALHLPATSGDFFTDDETSVHEADINRVAAAGITTGCAPNRYCPKATVTRQEMASFLVRAYALPNTTTDFFTDDEGSIHERDINRLAASGITGGCGGTRYCPTQGVTRGQMTAFLRRAES